MQTYETPA